MSKHRVHLQTEAFTSVVVEANDRDEAIEKAFEEDLPTICGQCSGWGQRHSLELGDVWDVPEADYAVEEVES